MPERADEISRHYQKITALTPVTHCGFYRVRYHYMERITWRGRVQTNSSRSEHLGLTSIFNFKRENCPVHQTASIQCTSCYWTNNRCHLYFFFLHWKRDMIHKPSRGAGQWVHPPINWQQRLWGATLSVFFFNLLEAKLSFLVPDSFFH